MTNLNNKDEEREKGDVFTIPTNELKLEGYEEDTKALQKDLGRTAPEAILRCSLKRIDENEAVGMTYVGSLDETLALEDPEDYWSIQGRVRLISAFEKRLKDLSNRPTPTHYSLRCNREWEGCYYNYMAFANFYRDPNAKGEK